MITEQKRINRRINRLIRRRVSELTGLPKHEATIVVASVLDSIQGLLVEGTEVQIVGFGIFQILYRSGRYRVRFHSSAIFREQLNSALAVNPPKSPRVVAQVRPRSATPAYKRNAR